MRLSTSTNAAIIGSRISCRLSRLVYYADLIIQQFRPESQLARVYVGKLTGRVPRNVREFQGPGPEISSKVDSNETSFGSQPLRRKQNTY